MKRYFGINGIPAAVLVDARGVIVWRGHPARLPDDKLQEALDGALGKPLWEWGPEAKKVKDALLDGKLAKALAEAEDLGEEYVGLVRASIASRVAGVRRAQDAGDWLKAVGLGEDALKALKDLPERDEVEALLDTIEKDKEAQVLIGAQKRIQKLLAKGRELNNRRKILAVIEDLEDLGRDHPGTIVDEQAKRAVTELRLQIVR